MSTQTDQGRREGAALPAGPVRLAASGLAPARSEGPAAEFAHRAIDLVGASVGLIVGAPLMLAAAIGIGLNMEPPVIFRQRRVGRLEKPFTLLKLRTMRPPLDCYSAKWRGPLATKHERHGAALTASERLTPTGRILRQLSIDELPQLWNVLRGEMALVGPRPLYPEYLPHYTPRERTRHLVRPGLTGLAQIGGRNRLQWDDRLELDAIYVETRSLWLDIRILLKTVVRVLRRENVMDTAIQGSLAKHRAGGLSSAASGTVPASPDPPQG